MGHKKRNRFDLSIYVAHPFGVNAAGTVSGKAGKEDLVTLGWERAGGLVTLFVQPWGPKAPLATPQTLFASDPNPSPQPPGGAKAPPEPSQRPVETLSAIAAALGSGASPMPINYSFPKSQYPAMVTAALACEGAVLIAWQHEDIVAIGQAILTQTNTPHIKIPKRWHGKRYDMVWVFSRPSGAGQIESFSIFAQMLLAGDRPAPPI